MGKVFRVRNVISDRFEPMKIVLPEGAGRPDLADRFLREIRAHASLEHPHIAHLRTAMQVDDRVIMIIELVDGETEYVISFPAKGMPAHSNSER